MKKVRYEIDPHNRLVIGDAGGLSGLTKFRTVLYGRFEIGKNNELAYHVKAPLSKGDTIPYQIVLKGRWSLTDNHDLRLTLDKWGRRTFGDEVILKGQILDVNKNSLLFAVTTKKGPDTRATYALNLEGVFQADKANRLTFHVKKEGGKYDILTFDGAWEINKDHEIIYRYEKADLLKKKKRLHTLTFKGHWDIREALRISYVLDGGTGSDFSFKTNAGVFKEGYIKYELGIGLARRANPVKKTVTLSGGWKLKKDLGLVFEIEYENKRTHAIVFEAQGRLTDRDTISFRLKNELENKDMGITLDLSREILKADGEAFLRLLKSNRESAVYIGAAGRW